ncbi:MAG TPA: glycosyl hydrolase family 39 [Terracidiphilus sp.]|jgi:xylan 1,4-beta-xylosidase|nr:glycosyl hydrolase family 39 [Terracidiphilus sp.]
MSFASRFSILPSAAWIILAALLALPCAGQTTPAQQVVIDAHANGSAFPHFWEQTFGSGHAVLALRDDYRKDLKEVHDQVGMRYVRFHGIFDEENGVYSEDAQGNPVYNWSYVDQIYDGVLANGVRPFVEISFMPKALASRLDYHAFWYKQIVSPPSNYAKWDALITAFAGHLVDRYGIDEVAQWYFEVWNEPNIDFWTGEPKQQTYFELYDHTARALKAVSPRLRVGGPATAAAHWIPAFLDHVSNEHVPIDFVSTHGYADDSVEDMFGTHEDIPMRDRVCRAIELVDDQIHASASPALPLMWTEWNVPSYGDLNARDNWYVGPALARDISQCDGKVKMMSFWTFDDVFEEGGVVEDPFHGGFGLIAAGRIRKPSFYDFSLLHELGDERIANPADNLLVTRRRDGTLVVAAWNLVDMDKAARGAPLAVRLAFKGVSADAMVAIQRVDESHGNPMTAYRAMGSPRYPTQAQIAALNRASALAAPEHSRLANGVLQLALPVNGLAVIEIPAQTTRSRSTHNE